MHHKLLLFTLSTRETFGCMSKQNQQSTATTLRRQKNPGKYFFALILASLVSLLPVLGPDAGIYYGEHASETYPAMASGDLIPAIGVGNFENMQQLDNQLLIFDKTKLSSSKVPETVLETTDQNIDKSQAVAPMPNNTHDFKNKTAIKNYYSFHISQVEKMRCGGKKCFLRLKDVDFGFLVTHDRARFSDRAYREFVRTYSLATGLRRDYNVSTLLLEPPQEILHAPSPSTNSSNRHQSSTDIFQQLNNYVEKHPESGGNLKETRTVSFDNSKSLVLQKVQVAPEPNMLWQMWYAARGMAKDLKVYTKFINTTVVLDGKQAFANTLRKNLAVTKRLLQDNRYACLNNDFQFILDFTGNIHHLDLDRCFEKNMTGAEVGQKRTERYFFRRIRFVNTIENCFHKALTLHWNVSSWLQDGELTPSTEGACKE